MYCMRALGSCSMAAGLAPCIRSWHGSAAAGGGGGSDSTSPVCDDVTRSGKSSSGESSKSKMDRAFEGHACSCAGSGWLCCLMPSPTTRGMRLRWDALRAARRGGEHRCSAAKRCTATWFQEEKEEAAGGSGWGETTSSSDYYPWNHNIRSRGVGRSRLRQGIPHIAYTREITCRYVRRIRRSPSLYRA